MRTNRPVLLAVVLTVVVVAPVTQVAATVAPSGSVTADADLAAPSSSATVPDAGDRPPSSNLAARVVRTQTNTSNYLDIRDAAIERDALSRPSLDVSASLRQDVVGLQSEYESLTFEHTYENRTGQSARADTIRAEVARLEERVQSLQLRQNRLVEEYNAGSIATDQFLGELAAIDARARSIQSQFQRIRQAAGLELPTGANTRMANLQGEILELRGPVRQQVGAAVAGERPAVTVYTVTSSAGLVMSSVEGPLYYREAYLGQNRRQVGTDEFVASGVQGGGVSAANNRASGLYPWTYANRNDGPEVEPIGNTSIYNVRLSHPHGTLQTYLDGRSEDVFREFQVKRLDAVPTRTTTNSSDGVVLTINRTHGTGPMQVSVTDNETAQPLNATVVVNETEVGVTGADGTLWTLAPQQSVRIEVETESGTTVRKQFFAD